MTYAYACITKS